MIPPRMIRIYFFLTTLEGLASLFLLLSLPKSSENTWLFGYSFSRVFLIAGMFIPTLGIAWATFRMWNRPEWQEKLQSALKVLTTNESRLHPALTLLSALTTTLGFFLFFWGITEDEYYLGYLTRIGPILIFAILVSLQTFVLIISKVNTKKRTAWMGSLIAGLGLVAFQGWSLIWFDKLENTPLVISMFFVTFYLQSLIQRGFHRPWTFKLGWLFGILFLASLLWTQSAFIPKRYLIYTRTILIYSPMAAIGLIVLTHALKRFFSVLQAHKAGRVLVYLFMIVGFVYAGSLYFLAGKTHAEKVNITYTPNDDENAFMDFVVKVRESGFRYTGWRNQMPVYPYIQALFYDPSLTVNEFFERGKLVNIALSLVSLTFVFLLGKRLLDLDQAINLTLITAFGLYVFKSGYFLVELLYYTIAFLAYVLLCMLLVKPSREMYIATGLVLGIGHLTKASILPGFLLFIGVVTLREIFTAYSSWKKIHPARSIWGDAKPVFVNLTIAVACFLAITAPYLLESKLEYGEYFYNSNTDFLWYDSYGEALEGTLAHEEFPLPIVYFQIHSTAQIWGRIQYGLHWQMENLQYQYGFFNYLAFLALFLLITILLNAKYSLQIMRHYFHVMLFALLYFAGYFFLCIWYSPIANMPRFLYALYVPFVFSVFVVCNQLKDKLNRPLIQMASLALFSMVLIDIWHTISRGPFFRDFGS